jgi:hypothetical protein
MKIGLYLFLIGFLISQRMTAQDIKTSSEISLTVISQINQGNSYITFPLDIGNIEPLWFEANLIPNFYLRKSKNSRLTGVLTPQIIIRMYQEESFPVRTPSYIPQITVYYRLDDGKMQINKSLFGRIAHHSNGQENNFYTPEGEINLKSGNFSTNFVETGFIFTNVNHSLNAWQFFKTSLEIHPNNWQAAELPGLFSNLRWHNAFSIFKIKTGDNDEKSKKPVFSIKGEAIWLFGDFKALDSFDPKRLNISLTLYYLPLFMEDVGLFAQFYHGKDYYNIYFDHDLSIIRFGIMTQTLRF